uniref:Uncharacterized protein n=1 Tax=Arundo donax TaxID=35708 RepID=A0A0A9EN18_ARUDO
MAKLAYKHRCQLTLTIFS